MNGFRVRFWLLAGAFGLGLTLTSGCQTWFPETGQTLPSGYYLRHPPQYFPPTPPFPLPKEQNNLDQAVFQQPRAGGPAGP